MIKIYGNLKLNEIIILRVRKLTYLIYLLWSLGRHRGETSLHSHNSEQYSSVLSQSFLHPLCPSQPFSCMTLGLPGCLFTCRFHSTLGMVKVGILTTVKYPSQGLWLACDQPCLLALTLLFVSLFINFYCDLIVLWLEHEHSYSVKQPLFTKLLIKRSFGMNYRNV